MNFSNRLKYYRKKMGFTQEELANKLGMKRSTYAKYETGENEPNYTTLEKIADFFDITTDDLLGRERKSSDPYNSLKEIDDFIHELGFDSIGFFDIEKWKDFEDRDIEEIKNHFEWVAHKAKKRKGKG